MRITLKNLSRTYSPPQQTRIQAVRAVSLDIPSGSIYGIIGKSGAGKSTLLRLLSLLEKPDAGALYYAEQRVDDLPPRELIARRRRNGLIFQNFCLFASRTARENIAYPLEICGRSRGAIQERTAELLELVGLAGRGDAPISALSGGQKQRVAIARALANEPAILFCDEATSALDPQTTRDILDLIRRIKQKMQLTVVLITHQMEVVRDICEYVAVLDNGSIVETGRVQDIFVRPQAQITRDFLAHLTAGPAAPRAGSFVRWSAEGGQYTLRFVGAQTGEPLMSELVRRYPVSFNIRAGGIQYLPEQDIGTLVTDLTGEPEAVAQAIEFLRNSGVIVEESV
ncbi:MAG: methionine ABC transporter ATP-binding protein [Candidatus Margulisbacteria bacterium]|jgi:D-methionine transport system ATP-binding protein|nr:methionine ABC transporter ATP-binding protein [Candidatus Margulisiibacteriota bacterium]